MTMVGTLFIVIDLIFIVMLPFSDSSSATGARQGDVKIPRLLLRRVQGSRITGRGLRYEFNRWI